MAEFVELNAEEMIPELELMEKMQLFDKNQIKNITKKRKDFEYKLQRTSKGKEDTLRYIQYEMDLMKLIRRKKAEKGLNMKKNNVDYAVANHINKLFNAAIRRFPSDVRIWLSYMKFCKQVRFYTSASRVLDQMLELHGDKPTLFKLAAQWEFDECQCVEKARKFLLNGLHIHKDSRVLYTEAVRLELSYAQMKRKEVLSKGEDIDPSDPVLQGKLAEVMYDSAVKKIVDVTFIVDLLALAKEFNFTEAFQKKILDDLVKKFPNEELTWDTLAKRELEMTNKSSTSDPPTKLTPKDRIKNCTGVYDKAVQSVNTQRMWQMYVDRMLELGEDFSVLPNVKKNSLTKALIGAHNNGMLNEKYYLIWINKVDILYESEKDKKLYQILKWGTEKLCESVTLWTYRLKYHLTRGDEEGGLEVFRDGDKALKLTSLPLWKLMLQYFQTTNPMKVDELFQEGIKREAAISSPLKPLYLEWLTLNRGIFAARKAYQSLAELLPHCLQLHIKMADLEDMQPKLNLKQARKCHLLTTQQFGQNNTDVWMAYVKFEQVHGDPKNVSEVYARAIKTLRPNLVDIFVSEFSLSKAESFSSPMIPSPVNVSSTTEQMDTS